MGALLLVCAAGASTPALLPSANALNDADSGTTTLTTPTDTTPTDTTPTGTTPTDTTPTDTTPTGTTPTDTTPTDTTATTSPPETTTEPPRPPREEEEPYEPPPAPKPAPAPAPASPPVPTGQPSPSRSTTTASPGSTGTAAAPAPERCKHADARVSAGAAKVEAALRCLVDAERWSYGLNPLSPDARLDAAAARHAQDMVARGYFGHVAPDPAPFGGLPGDRILNAGYAAAVWGENLAVGHRSAGEVVRAWMDSPVHREELLDGRFTQMGAAFLTGEDGRVRWAQVFARPLGEPEPVHERLDSAARAAGGELIAAAERRGRRIVVWGELEGTGKLARRLRITALRGSSVRSRTIAVRPGRRFAASIRPPVRKGRVRVLVRIVGSGAAPLRLST